MCSRILRSFSSDQPSGLDNSALEISPEVVSGSRRAASVYNLPIDLEWLSDVRFADKIEVVTDRYVSSVV